MWGRGHSKSPRHRADAGEESGAERASGLYLPSSAGRTRGGGRSIGRAVVFWHAPFDPSTQKLRTFSHTKIIIRSTCARCARKKRAAVCIFQPFTGVFFLFIVRIMRNQPQVFCSLRATAALQSLHPRTSCVDDPRFRGHRAHFLHGEQTAALSFPLDGTNRCTKTAKPPTDTQGVGRRFGRCWIGIGALLRRIAVGGTAIELRRAAGLRLSGRCWQ